MMGRRGRLVGIGIGMAIAGAILSAGWTAASPCTKDCAQAKKACIQQAVAARRGCMASKAECKATFKAAKKACVTAFKSQKQACRQNPSSTTVCSPSGAFLAD